MVSTNRVQIRLESMAQGGEAVGRSAGQVVFVRGGLPGEVVVVRITERQRAYARGVVEEVREPSPGRVLPRCPLFGRCGGCHWQYVAYPAQVAAKRAIVEEQCRHLGQVADVPVAATLGMEDPWGYRSAAELHVAPAGPAGYYAAHSHEVVPLANCPLLVPALDTLLPDLQRLLGEIASADRPAAITLRWSWAEDTALLLLEGGTLCGAAHVRDGLAGRVAEVSWSRGRQLQTLAGRGFFYEALAENPLRVSPTSFFQVNVPQARRLLQVTLALLDPGPGDRVLDAYAGVGALSLPLAGRVRQLTAIEGHPAAVADLLENARRWGGGGHVEVLGGLVERVLPAQGARYDLVILDPPRRGCLPAALQAVLAAQPRRIVYVSCHPGTLARDVRALAAGGYRLRQLQPVDLFPQTFHIESVALLERDA